MNNDITPNKQPLDFQHFVDLCRQRGFDNIHFAPSEYKNAKEYCDREKEKGHNDLKLKGNRIELLKFRGNSLCKNNALSFYLKCAVNPKGDCGECEYFESIEPEVT